MDDVVLFVLCKREQVSRKNVQKSRPKEPSRRVVQESRPEMVSRDDVQKGCPVMVSKRAQDVQ